MGVVSFSGGTATARKLGGLAQGERSETQRIGTPYLDNFYADHLWHEVVPTLGVCVRSIQRMRSHYISHPFRTSG